MSHEQAASAPEIKYPHWEMQLSWEDLLVAVIERKILPENGDCYPTEEHAYFYRHFKAQNGDSVRITGLPDDYKRRHFWLIKVASSNNLDGTYANQSTAFSLGMGESSSAAGSHELEIKDGDQSFPISSGTAEALLGIIATMVPTGETEYVLQDHGKNS